MCVYVCIPPLPCSAPSPALRRSARLQRPRRTGPAAPRWVAGRWGCLRGCDDLVVAALIRGLVWQAWRPPRAGGALKCLRTPDVAPQTAIASQLVHAACWGRTGSVEAGRPTDAWLSNVNVKNLAWPGPRCADRLQARAWQPLWDDLPGTDHACASSPHQRSIAADFECEGQHFQSRQGACRPTSHGGDPICAPQPRPTHPQPQVMTVRCAANAAAITEKVYFDIVGHGHGHACTGAWVTRERPAFHCQHFEWPDPCMCAPMYTSP